MQNASGIYNKGSMTRFEDGMFSLRIEPAHEHRLSYITGQNKFAFIGCTIILNVKSRSKGPINNNGVFAVRN
ncbi:hypothetical protein PAESOLCIP111_04435 [Paenibacillus solanacearum]|uniref:Uncharacterized protein n=1 Tax=Paenibacillus solanacearum TaxID=2048548 RepID=A0A916NYB4_9BACL|nr:hypothetical protein PAESOLCIP111_04435 [Paenibacillus solanacearum]